MNLHLPILENTNLTGAKVDKELHEHAQLQDAIMPNGQKYEEWLKDKEDRGEDREKPGPS